MWAPLLASTTKRLDPTWTQEVQVERRDLFEERQQIRLQITHPPAVVVRFVRVDGRAVDFCRQQNGRTTLVLREVAFRASSPSPSLDVRLCVERNDEFCRIERKVPLDVFGAARLTSSGWHSLEGDNSLTTDEAQQSPFRFWLPSRVDGQAVDWEEWVVMEGDTRIGRPSRRPRPLRNLTGLGAPLTIRCNSHNGSGSKMRLAKDVLAPGLLADVHFDPHAPEVARLELRDEIEPDREHRVIWWEGPGCRVDLKPILAPNGPSARWWEVDAPADSDHPLAVAIAYGGTRVGLWYSPNWAQSLGRCSCDQAAEVAALLRWLRLPVFAAGALSRVRSFAHRHSSAVLSAWLADKAPCNLRLGTADDGWGCVIRAVFRDWQPSGSTLDELLNAVVQLPDHGAAMSLVLALAEIDPLLMGRVLHCYLTERHAPKHGRGASPRLLRNLARDIAGLPETAVREWDQFRNSLIAESARALHADEPHVWQLRRNGLACFRENNLSPHDAQVLEEALANVERFRCLLALAIIDELIQSLPV